MASPGPEVSGKHELVPRKEVWHKACSLARGNGPVLNCS